MGCLSKVLVWLKVLLSLIWILRPQFGVKVQILSYLYISQKVANFGAFGIFLDFTALLSTPKPLKRHPHHYDLDFFFYKGGFNIFNARTSRRSAWITLTFIKIASVLHTGGFDFYSQNERSNNIFFFRKLTPSQCWYSEPRKYYFGFPKNFKTSKITPFIGNLRVI